MFDANENSTLVDRIAVVLLNAWEGIEDYPVNASYVATFADMAKSIVANFNIEEK